ncbi:chemotaxis protein CheW [Tumidithrix elongata RA019]|uniref:Chemotaxis protein CheW n=1 Tax=Tumidithrix elongata BACA0141 TaxID=2716417 RepID=A0AAW9Q3N0_9CYAN|nr:chemotaxis protein CheW [Tumidithrix elongata RA019]
MANQVIELTEKRVLEVAGLPYLTLQLEPKFTVAVPLHQVQETFVAPRDRLTLLPNMSMHVLGLIAHRSMVFWVIDLPQLFGLGLLEPSSREYQIAVLRSADGEPLGIAVEAVKDVIRLTLEEISSPDGIVEPNLMPYLEGCVSRSQGNLWVLNAEKITSHSA